jgi:hypothetical protein
MCWKKFKIVSPNGKECCFPVPVPWWCCDDSSATPIPPIVREDAAAQPEITVIPESTDAAPAPRSGCMSASQLLMQRYVIANPPRASDPPAWQRDPAPGAAAGAALCEDCDEIDPLFTAALEKAAVLIPSETSAK